jgi:glutaredoxin-like YruB-family protein
MRQINKNMKKVTIYSAPTCHYCHMAKDFFKAKGVEYTDYDVAADVEKRQEMMTKSGQMGVPVIVIGDEVIVGFDEAAISHLLEI